MKTIISKLAFVAIIFCMGNALADSLEETTIKVGLGFNTCTGARATCPTTVTVTGALEPVKIDINNPKTVIKDLGTITKEKEINLELPVTLKTHKVFKFTPSTGEMAGKKIVFALDNVKPYGRYKGKDLIKIYRSTGETDQPWIDVGNLPGNIARLPKGTTLPFRFSPDGTLSSFDAVTKTYKEISMGQKEL